MAHQSLATNSCLNIRGAGQSFALNRPLPNIKAKLLDFEHAELNVCGVQCDFRKHRAEMLNYDLRDISVSSDRKQP